jgi:hypothetical protein
MCRKLIYLASFVVVSGMVSNANGQLGKGNILYEYWFDISSTAVSALTSNPRYPDNPDEGEWQQRFEGHVDWRDNYGTRARGYLYPPATGDYTFWIAGDDECQLWLSTNDDPANVVRIANVSGWTPARDFTNTGGGAGGPEQKSKPVSLQAGRKYYIEALMKEEGGGDSLAVAWGGPTIGSGPVVIEGKYLSPVIRPVDLIARNPDPADGSILPDTWASLTWSAGVTAVSHDVYFSDNLADVEARATKASLGNQSSTNFLAGFPGFPFPDGFVPGTTYYWRIDEIEANGTTVHKGNVWSFMVPPKTAYNPDPADGADSVDPNIVLSWTGGLGAIMHYVYFGDDFDVVKNAAGGMPWGSATYTPGTLELEKAYYWRIDAFYGFETCKGDVWGFMTPGAVANPKPSNGAIDVKHTQILKWVAADSAASHQVYFGTDKEVVRNANTGSPEYKGTRNLGSESYDPGKLEWDTTYYWRVDGVNNANPKSPWVGLVWSFTTADFLVVDDFEDYDMGNNEIWWSWKDGLGYAAHGNEPAYPGNGTGAAVGDESTASYTEETIVHGGNQALPLFYDNSVLKYSEAQKTLTYPRDWTEKGVNTLTIWFRGDSANAAETLYVALNGSAVVSHDNPKAAQIRTWTKWNIDLKAFADQGVNLANAWTMGTAAPGPTWAA